MTALYVTSFGSYLRLWATDDDRHLQPVNGEFLVGGGVRACVRHWVTGWCCTSGRTTKLNMAHFRRGTRRRTTTWHVALRGLRGDGGAERPEAGWSRLTGEQRTEGRGAAGGGAGPRTDEPLAGYGAEDCDCWRGGTDEIVTWGGLSLKDVTAEEVRLRLRVGAAGRRRRTSPALYAWSRGRAGRRSARPSGDGAASGGTANPTAAHGPDADVLVELLPTRRARRRGVPGDVASSTERSGGAEGDIWDTGPVASAATEGRLRGPVLADETTYFWRGAGAERGRGVVGGMVARRAYSRRAGRARTAAVAEVEQVLSGAMT